MRFTNRQTESHIREVVYLFILIKIRTVTIGKAVLKKKDNKKIILKIRGS